jgi:dimethylhistidine N-methyltransferase
MTKVIEEFLADVIEGLERDQKTLPCKYFYDKRGSELFEEICDLEEYYPTRADLDATTRNIGSIADKVGAGCLLVELGSGSSTKTRVLLDNLPDLAGYVPIDISSSALEQSAASLRTAYPDLEILPVCADYTREVDVPKTQREPSRRLIYFPGSTIGNFRPPDAIAFLRRIGAACSPNGAALIGADLKKDKNRIERAYDDAKGVTAAFNLNLLTRINRELGANFDLDAFEHAARYNEALSRNEMHLVSLREQTVTVGARTFTFAAQETIRTELSHKYDNAGFATMAAEALLRVDAVWTDAEGLFSLQYLVHAG